VDNKKWKQNRILHFTRHHEYFRLNYSKHNDGNGKIHTLSAIEPYLLLLVYYLWIITCYTTKKVVKHSSTIVILLNIHAHLTKRPIKGGYMNKKTVGKYWTISDIEYINTRKLLTQVIFILDQNGMHCENPMKAWMEITCKKSSAIS